MATTDQNDLSIDSVKNKATLTAGNIVAAAKDKLEDAKDIIADFTNLPGDEGYVTAGIENATSKLPSLVWLGLAGGSMVLSGTLLATTKKKDLATFVGLWAPCFLLLGIYNKIVKLEGNGMGTTAKKAASPRSDLH